MKMCTGKKLFGRLWIIFLLIIGQRQAFWF